MLDVAHVQIYPWDIFKGLKTHIVNFRYIAMKKSSQFYVHHRHTKIDLLVNKCYYTIRVATLC